MCKTFYRKLTVFTVSILFAQFIASTSFTLLSVAADTIDEQEEMSESEISDLIPENLPGLTAEEEENVPYTTESSLDPMKEPLIFTFTPASVQGKAGESITIHFKANQDTTEAKIKIPQEAIVSQEDVPSGMRLEKTEDENMWIVRSEQSQKTFAINVIFKESGLFEARINDARVAIEILSLEEDNTLEEVKEPLANERLEKGNVKDSGKYVDQINYLSNVDFFFNKEDTRIPQWEIASANIPVVAVKRDLEIFPDPEDDELYRIATEADYRIKRNDGLTIRQVHRPVRRTFFIVQTIPTVKDRHYTIGINSKSLDENGLLYVSAYRPPNVSANSPLIKGESYDLTSEYEEYTVSFKATGSSTNISYRVVGAEVSIKDPFVYLEEFTLNIEATPVSGGNPTSSNNIMTQGEATTLSANPNEGYRFARWDVVSGQGSDVISPTDPNTTFLMGIQDTLVRAVYVPEESAKVYVQHLDKDGHELADTEILTGVIGEFYETNPLEIDHYNLIDVPENAQGVFEDDLIFVTYIYDLEEIPPLDPLFPDESIDPENKPDLPIDQGLFSIDFASQIEFGRKTISTQERSYEANPQRILNEDGSVNDEETRPNYVQISDRRADGERNNWQLAVRQVGNFATDDGQELIGANLRFENQQLNSSRGDVREELQPATSTTLLPDERQVLFEIPANEESSTWFYLLGDENTAGNSVILDVPRGTNPTADRYATRLVWEISSVPNR